MCPRAAAAAVQRRRCTCAWCRRIAVAALLVHCSLRRSQHRCRLSSHQPPAASSRDAGVAAARRRRAAQPRAAPDARLPERLRPAAAGTMQPSCVSSAGRHGCYHISLPACCCSKPHGLCCWEAAHPHCRTSPRHARRTTTPTGVALACSTAAWRCLAWSMHLAVSGEGK